MVTWMSLFALSRIPSWIGLETKKKNELIAVAFTYCLQGIIRRMQEALLYLELSEVLNMRGMGHFSTIDVLPKLDSVVLDWTLILSKMPPSSSTLLCLDLEPIVVDTV